jgi:hypothetical protein
VTSRHHRERQQSTIRPDDLSIRVVPPKTCVAGLQLATQESDMAETSIAADVASEQPGTWPLLRKLRDLVTRLWAGQRARRLAMIARVMRSGLSHID